MTDFGRRVGAGDMLKSVYDTNDDGVVDSAPAHKLTHQAAGSDEIVATGLVGRTDYVDRGDPAAYDWTQLTLTTDGNWHDLDCSGIVPAGAKAISFRMYIIDGNINVWGRIRKNGNTNDINCLAIYVEAVWVSIEIQGVVACDAARKCQYSFYNQAWAAINITVLGWFV